jgi:uncharacterized protein YfaA (DUF2138 family)
MEHIQARAPRESNRFSSNYSHRMKSVELFENAKKGPILFDGRIEGQRRLKIIRGVLPLSQRKKGETQMFHVENSEIIAVVPKIQIRISQNVSHEEMRKPSDEYLTI